MGVGISSIAGHTTKVESGQLEMRVSDDNTQALLREALVALQKLVAHLEVINDQEIKEEEIL